MDRKTKGRLAEAAVLKELAGLGYEVYIPFSDCSKYDLLARIDDDILRVSVKYTSMQTTTGRWNVGLTQVSRRNDSKIHVDKFDANTVDILAVYIGPEDRVVLRYVDFTNTSTIYVD